jgi:hypothetical protein
LTEDLYKVNHNSLILYLQPERDFLNEGMRREWWKTS